MKRLFFVFLCVIMCIPMVYAELPIYTRVSASCENDDDLVNIYFQPCCSDYEYTEILLYIPQDYVTVGGPYGPVKKPSSWQMFKKCKVPAEDFYKSINGLAYGTYAYVIKQFDKKDNLLLETEYIEFSLKAPKQPIMGRINRI